MIKQLLYQPPFPIPNTEAEAIFNIGFMFADIFILFFLMILMIYIYKKLNNSNDFLYVIIVYLFSLLFGMEALTHIHTHFSPILEIFFLLFQTSFFLVYALEYYKLNKR